MGSGTLRNERMALECFFHAAKNGDCHAMNDIGIYFANGCVVEKSETEAFNWFKKAAANGDNADAINNLATCYENGIGVDVDYEEALRLRFEALKLEGNNNGSE